MIQRIQSIFLFLVAACYAAALFMPLAYLQVENEVVTMTAFSMQPDVTNTPVFWVGIAMIVVIMVAVYSVFQYKNRLLQMKLGTLISFATAATVALIWLLKGDYPTAFAIGMWLVLGSLVFNFLSNWFIRRDEKMVRDSNRLR